MKGIALLGSTGSIGTSTLNVLRRHPDQFRLVAIVTGSNHRALQSQVDEWHPEFAAVVNGSGEHNFESGEAALVAAATRADVDIVVNAVVGAIGLEATLAALRAGKRVALANKETLVMAGAMVTQAAIEGGGELVPIDSEHSAVLQCMVAEGTALNRLILTASGGPFRQWSAEQIQQATVEQALNHPTWSMGAKISIDSASLANKALEVIEAHFLFGLAYHQIEVVVHPQSIVHAFVEFPDRSMLAQVGFPTMEIPILYALTHPLRLRDESALSFDPTSAGMLTFESVDHGRFPTFQLGVDAGKAGGTAPAVFNAANEIAAEAFLNRRIPFGRIPELIDVALQRRDTVNGTSLEELRAADSLARIHAVEAI